MMAEVCNLGTQEAEAGVSEHGHDMWGAVTEAPRERRSLLPQCILFSGLFWMWFCASHDKHVHSVYETCLFLLDVRTQLQNPGERTCWVLYRCAWFCTWPLPCCHAFPDIIYGMHQEIVFKLVCPENVLKRGSSAHLSRSLLMVVYMFFWTQAFSGHCFLCYICV